MPQSVSDALQEYIRGLHNIYGSVIEKIILYGSYARGDFNYSSDVDILVLVNMDDDEIRNKKTELANFTFDVEMECGVVFSPVVANVKMYYRCIDILPFYRNIQDGKACNLLFVIMEKNQSACFKKYFFQP